MPSIEILGYLSGTVISLSFIPQVVRVFRLKSAREISLPFTILMLCGVCGWLAYGILLGRPSMIWANSAGVALSTALLIGKFKYGRKNG